MEECAHPNGSGVERLVAEGIEVLIFAEKLRGTHLCLVKSVLQRGDRHDFEFEINFGQLDSLDWLELFPVGPHALHGWI